MSTELEADGEAWVAITPRELEELRSELEAAQKSAAAWEIQAQDLRDKLVALESHYNQLLASLGALA